jgi:hypothetical protein
METQVTYPRVRAVKALPNKKLLVTFATGDVRVYDCKPLLKEEVFRELADEQFFQRARPDPHGYAVIWSDEVDLAESELWINGNPAEQDAGANHEERGHTRVPNRTRRARSS